MTIPPSQIPIARSQCWRPARTAIPTVSTPSAASSVIFVPMPRPAASAPRKSGPAPTPASTRGSPVTGTSVTTPSWGCSSSAAGSKPGPPSSGARGGLRLGRRLGRTGYSRRRPGRGGAVDQEGEHREQEEEPHDVVGRVAGLRADQHLGVQHHGGAEQGRGADRVGAPDAPRRQQRHRQPAEVDQGRERVVVERDHRDRVQQLGVLRVVPGGELERIGEVQRPDLAGLREPAREGHVVPGGVLVVHAGVQGLLGRLGPVRHDQRRGADRDRRHQLARLDRGELVVRGADVPPPGPVGGAEPDQRAGEQQRHLLEQLQQPQQLRDHDQGRDAQHELRQPGQRARPGGNEQGSHVVGA